MIRFTHTHDGFYASDDGFAKPYIIHNDIKRPILSVALSNAADVVFDNIHYAEQLECYKECLAINQSFMKVITHDLHILELQKQLITTAAKLEMFTAFVEELKQVI